MTPQNPLTPAAITRLLKNSDPWLSCDDCFEQLDVAIEVALRAQGPIATDLRVHLTACAVCQEEAHSLASLVAHDHGLEAAEATARLDEAIAGR